MNPYADYKAKVLDARDAARENEGAVTGTATGPTALVEDLDALRRDLWPVMPDPEPTDRLRVVEGVQAARQRINPHLLPHQLQGSSGPTADYLDQRRREADKYRRWVQEYRAGQALRLRELNSTPDEDKT